MSETTVAEKPALPAIKAILGQKIGMTQIFTASGQGIPVTVVHAGPCPITQVLTQEKNGYSAIQLAFGEVREKSVNKPDANRFKKVNVAPAKWTREFRVPKSTDFQIGQVVDVNVFVAGDLVDVSGVSKGKGFAG